MSVVCTDSIGGAGKVKERQASGIAPSATKAQPKQMHVQTLVASNCPSSHQHAHERMCQSRYSVSRMQSGTYVRKPPFC